MGEKKPQNDLTKLTDYEVSLLILERDVAQCRVERIEKILNKVCEAQGFIESQKPQPQDEQPKTWDPNKIKWTKQEGSRGPYEKSGDVNSSDFKALLKDLAHNNGKLIHEGLFYWSFESGSTVGRKPAKRS